MAQRVAAATLPRDLYGRSAVPAPGRAPAGAP